jgi:2,4-didehydro-3-deoxy-L-rhamnonate hydrolase
MPRGATKADWEFEFAVVISRKASYVSREEALNCVVAYVLHNDYSGRNLQLERGGRRVKGKSGDTFAPLCPFLATPDELPDRNRLKMRRKVNGEFRQDSSTAQMIFGVAELVSMSANS